jgi:hypothetical protein
MVTARKIRTGALIRLQAIFVLIVSTAAALAQQDIWSRVKPRFDAPQLSAATVSNQRLTAIHRLLRTNRKSIGWECGGDQLNDLLKSLTFATIPLSDTHEVLLVEAGAGCARGGQGSNGAMWLVSFDGNIPSLIATPKDGFNGWLFAIEPATSHGYHDLVLGWHMGAGEGTLNYLKFDGKSYKGVGGASDTADDDDNLKIVPIPK